MALRIAYLTTHYPSVSHTFIRGEIATLPEHGIDVVPMSLNSPGADDLRTDVDGEAARTFYVKAMPKLTIAVALVAIGLRHPVAMISGLGQAMALGGWNLALATKLAAQFLEGVLVWRHCRARGAQAIHAHFGQAPATVARFAARFGRATGQGPRTWSVTVHGWHEFVTEDTSRLHRKMADADLVVAISDYTRSQLMRISVDPALWSKIHVVRCGIDLALFAPRTEAPVNDPPLVTMTARLAVEKGHLVLLDALARLRAEGTPMRLDVIGVGPFADQIRAAAARHGVDDLVTFRGAMTPTDVAAALRASDAYCLPTFAEGLPVSLMEAMAIGVPVVTTYISGIPELVEDGVTGRVVPAGSVDELVTALREVVLERTDPCTIDAARERVAARHQRRPTVAELAALFERYHGRAA